MFIRTLHVFNNTTAQNKNNTTQKDVNSKRVDECETSVIRIKTIVIILHRLPISYLIESMALQGFTKNEKLVFKQVVTKNNKFHTDFTPTVY